MNRQAIVLAKRADSRIIMLRGQKVILDTGLAELYGVEVRHLNQQVKRNAKRFPIEFVFPLSKKEFEHLRSHCDLKRRARRAEIFAICLH